MDVDSFFLLRTTTARPGKGAKVGVAIGAIAAVIVVVLAALMIIENSNTGGTVIDVAADGRLTIKLVQASSVSAKVVEERTVAFGEE